MATTFIKKYPLDRTGKAVSNRVDDEPHDVGVQFNRIIAPNAGPYYEDSMVVYDTKGNPLVRGTDWDPLMPYVEASTTLGKPVSNMLVIKNKDITEVVLKTYQVPGGLFQTYTDAIINLVNSLMQDNRQVMWDAIGGKPIRFQPTPHLHHLKDLYGYEYEVLALEELIRAVQNGDIASHDVIYQYIDNLRAWTQDQLNKLQNSVNDLYQQVVRLDNRIDSVLAALDVVRQDLAAHKANTNNPHQVTKAQTGLGLVENFAVATLTDAQGGVVTNKYMTPALTAAYAAAKIFPVIQAHLNDMNNPHQVTKAQVGLGSVENFPPATLQEAQGGTATNRYVTPANVAQYVNQNVMPVINNHINDKNNPHGVTKAQTGLGSVDNFLTATNGEAAQGTLTNRFVTPAGVAEYGNTVIIPYINGHINNRNNPHGVTTDQIGAVPVTRRVNGKSLTSDITISTVIVGTIVMWGSDWIPPGWMICNGQGIPARMTTLRNLYGTNVPDFRGLFPRGLDDGRGIDPGRGNGTYQEFAMPDHQHYAGIESYYKNVPNARTRNSPGGEEISNYNAATGGISPNSGIPIANEVRPRNLAIRFIIATDDALV